MRLLIDMNLSPALCSMLAAAGFDATHWSDAGKPDAADAVLMKWARTNEAVVVTHDLEEAAVAAPEEPLRGRTAVGSLDVEIADNRQYGEQVGQESEHVVTVQ